MARAKPMTAHAALKRVLADGWKSDALAIDTAIAALILDGRADDVAAAEVHAAFAKHFAIMAAN